MLGSFSTACGNLPEVPIALGRSSCILDGQFVRSLRSAWSYGRSARTPRKGEWCWWKRIRA
jgi:hypothetical protein